MRGVENDRHAERLHLRDRTHVVDQPAVAEKRASLAQQDPATAAFFQFTDDVPHIPGGHELPFLHVDRPPGRRRREKQIGLSGQKRGDLQQVANFAGRRGLVRPMNVRGHRQTRGFLHAPQHGQPLLQTRSAIRRYARPVGLVERRLEDQLHAQLVGDPPQLLGNG